MNYWLRVLREMWGQAVYRLVMSSLVVLIILSAAACALQWLGW